MRPISLRFIIVCPLALVLTVAACGVPAAPPTVAPIAPQPTALPAAPPSQKPVAPPTTSANPLGGPPVYGVPAATNALQKPVAPPTTSANPLGGPPEY
jgi:hypothetical protein